MASLPNLTSTSTGKAVRDLETRLTALGFDPGTIDGRFDGDTVARTTPDLCTQIKKYYRDTGQTFITSRAGGRQ